jgi:hypothetical protein
MFGTQNGNEKVGLGGWLSVWFILTCFGLIRFVHDIDLHIFSDAKAMTDPNSEYYHPLWKPLLAFEFFLQFFNPLSFIVLIVLFFRKSRYLPRSVIFIYSLNLVLVLFDSASGILLAKSVNLEMEFPWKETLRSLFGICVWVPYFLKSKRVKATFIN